MYVPVTVIAKKCRCFFLLFDHSVSQVWTVPFVFQLHSFRMKISFFSFFVVEWWQQFMFRPPTLPYMHSCKWIVRLWCCWTCVETLLGCCNCMCGYCRHNNCRVNVHLFRIRHIFKAGIYFPSKFCARMRNLQQFTRLVNHRQRNGKPILELIQPSMWCCNCMYRYSNYMCGY